MIGLADKSIVMGIDDAKEYVVARISVLEQQKHELEQQLFEVDCELQIEHEKLNALMNPPQASNCCCCDEIPAPVKVIARRVL